MKNKVLNLKQLSNKLYNQQQIIKLQQKRQQQLIEQQLDFINKLQEHDNKIKDNIKILDETHFILSNYT